MGGFILFIIAVILAANGQWTLFYILIVLAVLSFLAGLVSGKAGEKTSASGKGITQVYHPHYISDDEYECGVCGARFEKELGVCPQCGARFNRSETDEEEYDDELEDELEMDDWDEEEDK